MDKVFCSVMSSGARNIKLGASVQGQLSPVGVGTGLADPAAAGPVI